MKNIEIKQNRGVAIIFVLVMLSIFFFAIMASIDQSFQSYKTTGNSVKEGSLQGTIDQSLFDARSVFREYVNDAKMLSSWIDLERNNYKQIMSLNGFSSYSEDVDFYKNFGSNHPNSLNERLSKLGLWINRIYYRPIRYRDEIKGDLPRSRFVYLRRNEFVLDSSGNIVVKHIPYKRYSWSVYRVSNSLDLNYHRGRCLQTPLFSIRDGDWDSWDTSNISVAQAFASNRSGQGFVASNLYNRPKDDPWLSVDHALSSIPFYNRQDDTYTFRQSITGKLLEELPAIDISKRLDMGRVGKSTPNGINTVDHPDWTKVPMLTKSGGAYDHLKDQLKANIIDYCDTDYKITTDIKVSDFDALNKKATYVGNEAVHNISEILINFVNRTDRNPDRCEVKLGAYVELQNMYSQYPTGAIKLMLIADVELYLLGSGGFRKVRDKKYTFSTKINNIGAKGKIIDVRLNSNGDNLVALWKKNNGSAARNNARLQLKQLRVALIREQDNQYLDFVDIISNKNYDIGVKKGLNINFKPYDIRVNSKKDDFYTSTGRYSFFTGEVPKRTLLSVSNDIGKLNKTRLPNYLHDAENELKKATVNFSNFSTSYFRNKPWKTTNELFELGAISRGEGLRTINLIEYNKNSTDLGEYRNNKNRVVNQKIRDADCGDRGLLRYMYVNEDHRTNPSYQAQKRVPILPNNVMWSTPFRGVFAEKKFIIKHRGYRKLTGFEIATARARGYYDLGTVLYDDDFFDYKERTGGQYGALFNTFDRSKAYNNDFLNEQMLMSTKDYFSNKIEYFYVVSVAQGLTYSQDHTGNRTVISPAGNKDTFFVDSETRVRALYGYDRIKDKFTLIEYKEF